MNFLISVSECPVILSFLCCHGISELLIGVSECPVCALILSECPVFTASLLGTFKLVWVGGKRFPFCSEHALILSLLLCFEISAFLVVVEQGSFFLCLNVFDSLESPNFVLFL